MYTREELLRCVERRQRDILECANEQTDTEDWYRLYEKATKLWGPIAALEQREVAYLEPEDELPF